MTRLPRKPVLRVLANSILICILATAANAQTAEQRKICERDFSPSSGQAGKDVIWVPTPDVLVTAMLKAAKTTANDIVYDLGAGDGKIAMAAAKEFGARAVGVEYEAKMARFATCLVSAAGLKDKVKIVQGDIFETDFSEATVVTLYLLPSLNEKLSPTLLKMKPGTRVVSHSFLMGDWLPDQHIVEDGYDRAYLWIVPAQVAGTWSFQSSGRSPLTVKLNQKFQALEGVVIEDGREMPIQGASVRGYDMEFTFVGPKGARTLRAPVVLSKTVATVIDGQQKTEYAGTRS
jgi:hypothetical protein